MIIPIRCFTCGKVTGNKWEQYLKLIAEYQELNHNQELNNHEQKLKNQQIILSKLNLERYCCRRIILTHVDLIEEILKFDYSNK